MEKIITGVILAGGKSSRMGSDKSFLKINGELFIVRILELMRHVFEEVLISANNSEPYKSFGAPIVHDIIPSFGPLSGIYSALKYTTSEKIFVTSCDMPLISKDILKYFVSLDSEAQIILPVINSIPQYDFGVYKKSVLPEIESLISSGEEKISLKKLTQKVETMLITPEKLPGFYAETFLNINTIENYQRLQEILDKSSLDQ